MKKLLCTLALALMLPCAVFAEGFMPKKAVSVGFQGSYFDLSGSNASVMLLLEQLNAQGSILNISPYFSWCYKTDRCIGLKFKYVKANGGIASLGLNLPGSDMELGLSELNAASNSFVGELFHRSYMGLDDKNRFGLFLDLALQYQQTSSSLGTGVDFRSDYTLTRMAKLAARPGLEVFVMNNVSTTVSIGIGGLYVSGSSIYQGGAVTGQKISSGARFQPDITDISMGIAVHF
ncbi:MAG: hypothetical protein ACI3Y4_06065 [Candidatus Cryptobacteroides sp.]